MKHAHWMGVAACLMAIGMSMSGAHAEIYKWKDANGKVHFGDNNTGQPTAKVVTVKVNSYNQVSYAAVLKSFNIAPTHQVVLYSTTWCGYCKKARLYFQKNNISFTEYDVESSSKGKADYLALQGNGVPIILLGKKRMNGFDAASFSQMYARK